MVGLAINGAQPLREKPFAPWPEYDNKEQEALLRVLQSRQWGTLGEEAEVFQKRFAEYVGSTGALAVSNGTAALEVVMRALDVGGGDEVILPPYTFIATASAVLLAGGTPVFADVHPETGLVDTDSIKEKITDKTKAIIPVHMAGIPADMDAVAAIGDKRGIPIIEDAAQAHGSMWREKRVGSIGLAGVFSFQSTKNMSSGEGGAITSNDSRFLKRCWSVHHVGRRPEGKWYEHEYLGGNSRISEWQAAVLSAQLTRLDSQIEKRTKAAEILNALLQEVPGIEPVPVDARVTKNTYHLFMFRYKKEQFRGKSKLAFTTALQAEGVPANEGYLPLYSQKMFTSHRVRAITGGRKYHELRLPGTEQASTELVWLPQYVLLSDEEALSDVAGAIKKLYDHAGEIPGEKFPVGSG